MTSSWSFIRQLFRYHCSIFRFIGKGLSWRVTYRFRIVLYTLLWVLSRCLSINNIAFMNNMWSVGSRITVVNPLSVMSLKADTFFSMPARHLLLWDQLQWVQGLLPYSVLGPWNRVILEKLSGFQLVKKFPAFYGNRIFITAVTSARHLSLSWASSIQSILPHPPSWRSVAHPGILFGGGASSANSVEDRGRKERGSGGGSPLLRGSGDSCNLVQEISFHIVIFS